MSKWRKAVASGVIAAAMVLALACGAAMAQGTEAGGAPAKGGGDWAIPIGVALSVGIGSIAGGYAVARVGAAALGAASERPELLMRSLIFVGMAEGIAIYGLVIAIFLWLKL